MMNKITNKKKIMGHLKLDGHIYGNTYIRNCRQLCEHDSIYPVDSYFCININVCFNEFKIKFLGLT